MTSPYGGDHQRLRRFLPRPNGSPCPFCRLPMRPGDLLDLDHVRPVVAGGAAGPRRWAHRSCNRREGARLGNARRFGRVTSRVW